MKHAIMIMAHKNFEFLHHLIEYFSRDCYVFVHIDKKSSITRDEEACLRAMPQVSGVYRKYSVHWGGFSILKCEIFLMKEALHSCDADYFHLISGQDYPIKPLSYFLQFFEENKGKEFLQYVHLPHPRWENNTFRRLQYVYLYDWFIRNKKNSFRIHKFIKWQEKRGLKRRIPDCFDHLYGNSQWFSITRSAVITLLAYTNKKPGLYHRMRFAFAPEECYVGTVLKNLLDEMKFAKYNYRYIRWKHENGNSPANLSDDHFHLLIGSDALIARKFEVPLSNKLLSYIDLYLLHDKNVIPMPTGGWEYDGYQKYPYHEVLAIAIHRFCQNSSIKSVVDVGCGSGCYVAALRRLRILATGFDVNPFTPKLSSFLLPKGDQPCCVIDITKEVETDEKFELVLFLDVFPYIPIELHEKAIANICKLTSKYVIVSMKIENEKNNSFDRLQESENDIITKFSKNGMRINVEQTNSLRTLCIKKQLEYIFFVFQFAGIKEELVNINCDYKAQDYSTNYRLIKNKKNGKN